MTSGRPSPLWLRPGWVIAECSARSLHCLLDCGCVRVEEGLQPGAGGELIVARRRGEYRYGGLIRLPEQAVERQACLGFGIPHQRVAVDAVPVPGEHAPLLGGDEILAHGLPCDGERMRGTHQAHVLDRR